MASFADTFQRDASVGAIAQSAGPNASREEQQHHYDRQFQLRQEFVASKPYNQFQRQIRDEKERIVDLIMSQAGRLGVGDDLDEIAIKIVKQRWVEQGIWSSKWDHCAFGRWKHEEPLEPEPETLSFFKPGVVPMSAEERRRLADRRAVREREREASRPYHQFLYQISEERGRIQGGFAHGESANATDINTKAYENVKNIWTQRWIWDNRWGILPGMSWKHEQPLQEMLLQEMGGDSVPANPLVHDSLETGTSTASIFNGASRRGIFGGRIASPAPAPISNGPPPRTFFPPPFKSPAQGSFPLGDCSELNHPEASGALNSPQQESPAETGSE